MRLAEFAYREDSDEGTCFQLPQLDQHYFTSNLRILNETSSSSFFFFFFFENLLSICLVLFWLKLTL